MQSKEITKNNKKEYYILNNILKIIGFFIIIGFFLVGFHNDINPDMPKFLISGPSEYLEDFGVDYRYSTGDIFFNITTVFLKSIILALVIVFLTKLVSKDKEEMGIKIRKKFLALKVLAYTSLATLYGVVLWHVYIHAGCAFGFVTDCYLMPDIIDVLVTLIIIIISLFWLVINYFIKIKNSIKNKSTQLWRVIWIAVAGIIVLLLFFLVLVAPLF
jgi:hypothetical protein